MDRGYTLIEVVIAVFLTAIVVTSVFSVAVSSSASGGKAERKMLAAQAAKSLSSALKDYVTGDSTISGNGFQGPNSANSGAARWNLHVPGVQTDSNGAVYALSPWPNVGTTVHTLTCVAAAPNDTTCFMPRALRRAPYNGSISYTVEVASPNGPPKITINTTWTEP